MFVLGCFLSGLGSEIGMPAWLWWTLAAFTVIPLPWPKFSPEEINYLNRNVWRINGRKD